MMTCSTSQLLLLLLAIGPAFLALSDAHIYRPGANCPRPAPIPHFDMDRFLGHWYVVQKTSTIAECLVYNITKTPPMTARSAEDFDTEYVDDDNYTDEAAMGFGESRQVPYSPETSSFRIEQIFYMQPQRPQRPTRGRNSGANGRQQPTRTYRQTYTGKLQQGNSSQMSVKFPLNVIGSSTFDVFATDYISYAGVFSCQPLLFMHRQSATFLSRTRTLSTETLKLLRYHLYDNDIQELALKDINQMTCGDSHIDIDIRHKKGSAQKTRTTNTTTKKDVKNNAPGKMIDEPADVMIETLDTRSGCDENCSELIWF